MRNRLIVPIVVLVAILGVVLLLARRGSNPDVARSQEASSLAPRTVMAGTVEVSIEPVRLDDSGAMFRVSLTTHSGDLAVDLAETARLEVDGTAWGKAEWNGSPPGGHHREGELSFDAGGPVAGSARLTIEGLPGPVEATWLLR